VRKTIQLNTYFQKTVRSALGYVKDTAHYVKWTGVFFKALLPLLIPEKWPLRSQVTLHHQDSRQPFVPLSSPVVRNTVVEQLGKETTTSGASCGVSFHLVDFMRASLF
jgi:hypothetical protein